MATDKALDMVTYNINLPIVAPGDIDAAIGMQAVLSQFTKD